MLRPELQDGDAFADGIAHLLEAHARCAAVYLADGSVADACPPLQALLHIMAHGDFEGKGLHDPDIRRLFTPEVSAPRQDWAQPAHRTPRE